MSELISTQIYNHKWNHAWPKIVESVIRKHEIHFRFYLQYKNRLLVQIKCLSYAWQMKCNGGDEKSVVDGPIKLCIKVWKENNAMTVSSSNLKW